MQVGNFAVATLLTITTAVINQTAAVSQTFKNPTHPVLSEINAATPRSGQVISQPVIATSSSQTSLSNSHIGFTHPPYLLRAATSQLQSNVPSTYEFTLTVPPDAGQPLKAVTITQASGLEMIRFDASQSRAFQGGRYAAGPAIPLASVGGEQPSDTDQVMVVFDQPVQPGNTVTVAIAAKANPNFAGSYEFGVTVYPVQDNAPGQFLGYRRINFYGNSD